MVICSDKAEQMNEFYVHWNWKEELKLYGAWSYEHELSFKGVGGKRSTGMLIALWEHAPQEMSQMFSGRWRRMDVFSLVLNPC